MFRIEQNGRMLLGRPKPPTKGSSAPDEEEEEKIRRGTGIQCNILCYNSPTRQSSVSDEEHYDMHLDQTRSTSHEMWATSKILSLHTGNKDFNTQNDE